MNTNTNYYFDPHAFVLNRKQAAQGLVLMFAAALIVVASAVVADDFIRAAVVLFGAPPLFMWAWRLASQSRSDYLHWQENGWREVTSGFATAMSLATIALQMASLFILVYYIVVFNLHPDWRLAIRALGMDIPLYAVAVFIRGMYGPAIRPT